MSATQRDAIRYFCQQKGMTKEELAKKINETFEEPSGEELIHIINKGAAIGRREMLDKACEWLFEYNKRQAKRFGAKSIMRLPDYTINVGDFRKAMEEQQ